MALRFRKALPSEREQADRVLRAAFTPYIRRLGREITPDYYTWLPASIERGDTYVADDDGRIVGVAATERRDDSLCIDRLAVDPAQQGTGTGSWMLERLDDAARSSGLRGMSLETAEMMDHLVRLYRRNGFEITGRGLPGHGKDAHMRVQMAKRFSGDQAAKAS
jgi:GNAT superfamily N-acetyltransferase